MTILIVLIVAAIATMVLAYFASRVWHWAYVLVVVGIVLATVGFFILSAEVLRNNIVLRRAYNKTEAELEKVNARIGAMQRGTSDSRLIGELRNLEIKIPEDAPSIRSTNELEHEIRLLTQARGPMWKNVMPTNIDQQTGTARINVEAPSPPGIVANSVVYVFEAGEPALPDPQTARTSGKQYLGEFRVTEANGQTATLVSALELDPYQVQRLAGSRGPWVMYETMPPDRHDIFAGMEEGDLRKIIPEASVEEYIRNGKPVVADDDVFRQTGVDADGKRVPLNDLDRATQKVYQRRLRDYAQEFRKLSQRRTALLTDEEGLKLDNQQLADALASAQRLTTFREDEIGKLKTDLAGLTKDRQTLDTLSQQVQQQLDAVRTMLIQLIQENSQLARELATLQSTAATSARQAQPAPAAMNPLAARQVE